MTDDIVVVTEAVALDEAYDMGYREFDPVPEAESDEPVDLSAFTETARYANHVAPRLRAIAGHADSGAGTYTVDRAVALVPVGNEDDEPADAVLLDASQFYGEVHDEWRRGSHDALKGYDHDHNVERHSRAD